MALMPTGLPTDKNVDDRNGRPAEAQESMFEELTTYPAADAYEAPFQFDEGEYLDGAGEHGVALAADTVQELKSYRPEATVAAQFSAAPQTAPQETPQPLEPRPELRAEARREAPAEPPASTPSRAAASAPPSAQSPAQSSAQPSGQTEAPLQTHPQAAAQPHLHLQSKAPTVLTADDFAALEERVLRAVILVRNERQARVAAEERVAAMETQLHGFEAQMQQLEAQGPVLERLLQEVELLRIERDQVRQRVERLLSQLDTLEL